MTYKTVQAYGILFNFLAHGIGEFEPDSIMADFKIDFKKLYARIFFTI